MSDRPLPVVFTDLDGTFLDHHTYDYLPAMPAVDRLKNLGGKLFAVSSKTLAEQKALFDHAGLFDGYIAENGGVLSVDGEVELLGPSIETIHQAKQVIEKAWGKPIPSFQINSLAEVIAATGLPEADARLACQRLCSDPLIFLGDTKPSPSELNHFADLVEGFGTRLVHGGRFATLCGHHTKGDAVQKVANKLVLNGRSLSSLALGDSANDLDMLHLVDTGVLISNESGFIPEDERVQGLTLQNIQGPTGWCLSVNKWLDEQIV